MRWRIDNHTFIMSAEKTSHKHVNIASVLIVFCTFVSQMKQLFARTICFPYFFDLSKEKFTFYFLLDWSMRRSYLLITYLNTGLHKAIRF